MTTRNGQQRVHDPLRDDKDAQEERVDLHEPEPWENLDEDFVDDDYGDGGPDDD